MVAAVAHAIIDGGRRISKGVLFKSFVSKKEIALFYRKY
jgi:hypothetical protein